ncbi:MAG: radical SAM/SPASM domain-containing protein [Pseudomonadota bacterium]
MVQLAPDLYTSRLVLRFREQGQLYLSSLLHPGSAPLYPPTAAVLRALWDRADRRPTDERLRRPGVPEDPEHLQRMLEHLVAQGLLIDSSVDEESAWYRLQQSELQNLPLVDQVELTNACPFTCLFCPRGLGQMSRPVGHMDLGLLAEIVAQVRHLPQRKPFGLHHFGDPLLHPDPAAAVRIVRAAGLEPEISVNPILLTERRTEALLDAGVGVLIVSVDGLDTATLHTLRGRTAGAFEVVERRIEYLIARAATLPRPPTLMISMVATVHNRHQWRELFARYSRPELPWLQPVVRLLEDFGDPQIQPLGVVPLRQACASPYKFVSILWDGTVVACCHDVDGAIDYGNLRTQSLAEIWAGERLQRFRERWQKRQFTSAEPCERCGWRIDRYLVADSVADTDAWTPMLWDEGPFPGPTTT